LADGADFGEIVRGKHLQLTRAGGVGGEAGQRIGVGEDRYIVTLLGSRGEIS